MQKRAARFVKNYYNYESGYMKSILNSLQWKSLKQRRKENSLILCYKGPKGKAGIPINDLEICYNHVGYQRDLTYIIPYAKSDIYRNSFVLKSVR